DHDISAGRLRAVEALVGSPEGFFEVVTICGPAGDSTADRQHCSVLADRDGLDLRAQDVCTAHRKLHVHARERHHELFTTVARDEVRGSDRLLELLTDLLERAITPEVAEPIIELLELVDVEDGDAELGATEICALELLLDSLVERAALEKAGELVGAD